MEVSIGKSGDGAVTLNVDRLIESRLLVTASSGGGKSYLLRKILEQVSAKTQTIVIDVEGEFATLREKRDMVLAGPTGEVPAEVRSAGLLCRRLMELNLSAVIDVSELPQSAKRDFISAFCKTMVELPRSLWRPCFVCIDETHEFAPEDAKSTSTDAIALLASKGRKRGYCLVAATQRLSKLDKDIAAECRNQFIGMMNLDIDRKRAANNLGFGKERETEIRDLSPPGREGEFFCFGPALNNRQVTKMRGGQVETTHPKAGQGRLSKPPEPSAKISGVLGELKDLAKKADEEAKTLADAHKRIRELERALKAKPGPAATAKPVIDRTILAEFENRERGYKTAIRDLNKALDSHRARMDKAARLLSVNGEAAPINQSAAIINQKPPPIHHNTAVITKPARKITKPVDSITDGDLQLGKAERSILTALYWLRDEDVTPAKVGFYADYTAGSGSFNNALGRLRSSGLLRGWNITEEGIAAAEAMGTEAKPTGDDLRQWLRRKLGKAENALLDALCEAYPERLTDEQLAEASGYTAGSGSFNNALGRLRSIEAAEGYAADGGPKASDVFFE